MTLIWISILEKTYKKGSILEFAPRVNTFAELRGEFIGGSDKHFKKRWTEQAKDIILEHYPDLGY